MNPDAKKPTSPAETPNGIATPNPPRGSRMPRDAARQSPEISQPSAAKPSTPIAAATCT
jgi:hypothetical protein